MKLARSLPSMFDLLTMELVLAFGIIGGVILLLLAGYQTSIQKAELSKLMSFAGNEKTELSVHMALTGDVALEDAPLLMSQRASYQQQIARAPLTARIANGGLRYEGTLDQPFYLSFTPSVYANADEPAGTVMWLCGNTKAPPGWTQPAEAGTNLPQQLLPSACRN